MGGVFSIATDLSWCPSRPMVGGMLQNSKPHHALRHERMKRQRLFQRPCITRRISMYAKALSKGVNLNIGASHLLLTTSTTTSKLEQSLVEDKSITSIHAGVSLDDVGPGWTAYVSFQSPMLAPLHKLLCKQET